MTMTLLLFARRAALCFPLALAAPGLAQGTDAMRAAVVQKELPVDIELSGVFEAEEKDEIRMEPKEYRGDLIVTKILAEGAAVKKGDVLIEFDAVNLTRALDDARNELADAEVALTKAKAEREALAIEQRSALAQLEQERAFAQQDLDAAKQKSAIELYKKERAIEDSKERMADADVDYQQLIQLYKERELHTATENILIDREKRKIEDMKLSLEVSIKELDVFKQFEQNRDVEKKQLELDKKKAEVEKATIKNAADLAEKESAVKKAERTLSKSRKKIEDLEADQKTLQVAAPRDGILFYGRTGDDMPAGVVVFGDRNNEMRVGGRVRTHEKLSIKMRALENDIQHMKDGLPITIVPDAFPAHKIVGKLTKVDQVASRQGFFSEVREFSVKGAYDGVFPELRAGMNCRVTVHADSVPDAIQVPVVAVFQDKGEHCCYVEAADGTARQRKVKIGVTNGSHVQITEGLKPQEKVLLYDPNR
jgi:multidrug efflux pump subunit AcrA (membrane-fusion protein)